MESGELHPLPRQKRSVHQIKVLPIAISLSADIKLLNDTSYFVSRNIVKRVFIFLFQPSSQIFSRNVTRFTVGKISSHARSEFNKTQMRKAQYHAAAIH